MHEGPAQRVSVSVVVVVFIHGWHHGDDSDAHLKAFRGIGEAISITHLSFWERYRAVKSIGESPEFRAAFLTLQQTSVKTCLFRRAPT